jgi:aspartyl-tRNA(Asn)/glutamyl-tRNA(Gln) amidotransferase subunit A
MKALLHKTIPELHQLFYSGELRVEELTNFILENINKSTLNAYITVNERAARERAKAIDEKIKSKKPLSPLAGIPIGVKDNICTQGLRTTCGSRILEEFIPPYHATVVEKLLANDAIIIGKTNMDEFAMGSSGETSFKGATRNPWNEEVSPGGSSSGSAAAVAAGEAIAALGSDTGGSIRQPASLCGVVGLKPTYGRVSRFGLIAFASSLDQIGVITRNVTDCAILMNVLAGYDPRDATSVKTEVPEYTRFLNKEIKGMVLGVPREYFREGLSEEIISKIKNGLKFLEKEGAIIEEVSLPHTEYAVSTYYITCMAEASSNLARYAGIHYGYRTPTFSTLDEMYEETRSQGFGLEVKRRIILGTYVLSAGYYEAYYLKAQKVRTLIKRDFEQAFKKVEAILTPTYPQTAFPLGEKMKEPLSLYLADIFTVSANLAGLPGISIPCGQDKKGLPIGLQILAPPLQEGRLLQLASMLEKI